MPDAAVTGADGWFHFDGLPDGRYAVEVSLPAAGSRYGTVTKKATVKQAADPTVRNVPSDLSVALPPTAVTGVVRDADGATVPMAELRIKGSGEKTLSDPDGAYRLGGIERGTRTVTVSARGLASAEAEVTLADSGSQATLDFALKPAG